MANPYAQFDEAKDKPAEGPSANANPYAAIDKSASEPKPPPQQIEGPPGWTIDEEINQWSGKKQWEHPDAPSTGRLELPGVNPFGKKDIEGNDALPIMSKLALQYGTLSTDNPKARQEIYVKHLPGAKAAEDKFGNPMIEYKGKKYYTSAPGVDAMDVGRVTAGVAGTLPAAALAPVSVPGMLIAGGLLGAGQSVAEDVVTQASGGTSQPIDPGKAALSGTVGALAGPILKSVVPVARRLYGTFAGELFDATGRPTARGATILREAGITPEQVASMTPEIRQEITRSVNQNFGSPDAAFAGQNRALGREFSVPQTTGEITGDATQLNLEKNIRGGSRGEQPQTIMREHGEARQEGNLTQAQEMIRNRTGVPARTPIEAGEAFNAEFGREARASRDTVRNAYRMATNEDAVVAAGGPRRVAVSDFRTLPNRIATALDAPGEERLIIDARNTPNAHAMVERINRLARGDVGDFGPPNTTQLSWNNFDRLRGALKQDYEAAAAAARQGGSRADVEAARRIMNSLDDHFGEQNPLLANARATAAETFQTFRPDKRTQTGLTQSVLRVLNKPEAAQEGAEVFNTLFSTKLGKGEALGAIDHLLTIHPPGSPGANTMAEQGLRKIFVNAKDGSTKTPRQIVTAIDQALGDAQGDVYRRLLTPDQINELIRFRTLNENIANAISQINPSGSGHVVANEARSAARRAIGGGGGAAIARILGLGPAAQAISGAAGAIAGKATGQALNTQAARAAIAPAANAGGVTSGQIAGPGGMLAAPVVEQPMDRIWRGLMAP